MHVEKAQVCECVCVCVWEREREREEKDLVIAKENVAHPALIISFGVVVMVFVLNWFHLLFF